MAKVNLADKKEGNQGECPNCGLHVQVKMSNYSGPYENKLQWQNDDGKAHLKWNGPNNYSCNVPEGQPQTAQQIPQKQQPKFADGALTGEQTKEIIQYICILKQVELIVRGELFRDPTTGEQLPVNDAKCGMYMKLVMDMMNT